MMKNLVAETGTADVVHNIASNMYSIAKSAFCENSDSSYFYRFKQYTCFVFDAIQPGHEYVTSDNKGHQTDNNGFELFYSSVVSYLFLSCFL